MLGMEWMLFNVVKVFPAGILLEAVHAVKKIVLALSQIALNSSVRGRKAVGLCKNKPALDTFPFPNICYKQHFTK